MLFFRKAKAPEDPRANTIALLDQAIAAVEKLGYSVRREWLAGGQGGACVLKGKKMLFLDLTASPTDQLDQVLSALRRDPELVKVKLPKALKKVIEKG